MPKLKRHKAAAISILGLLASLTTVYVFFWPRILKVLPPGQLVQEHSGTSVATLDSKGPLVGDHIVVPLPMEYEDSLYIVANRLEFVNAGRIKAPRIVIFAQEILSGTIDVSGANAEAPGTTGGNGGELIVVAEQAEAVTLLAAGARGARGDNGDPGRNGRNGRCGPGSLNQYVGATAGGRGGNGGQGGDGGGGGRVLLLFARGDGFSVLTEGGSGGLGGHGGAGGRGGRGCTGLGGTQATRATGASGNAGDPGTDGPPGSLVQREIKFGAVKRAMEEVDLGARQNLAEKLDALWKTLSL